MGSEMCIRDSSNSDIRIPFIKNPTRYIRINCPRQNIYLQLEAIVTKASGSIVDDAAILPPPLFCNDTDKITCHARNHTKCATAKLI